MILGRNFVLTTEGAESYAEGTEVFAYYLLTKLLESPEFGYLQHDLYF